MEKGLMQTPLAFSNESSHEGTVIDTASEDRDELVELQKLFQNDTKQVRIWRVLVTLGLTLTGVAVSVSSYLILLDQEHDNFLNAYNQFSESVSDAAVGSFQRAIEAAATYAEQVSYDAYCRNITWPFYDALPSLGFAQKQVLAKELETLNLLVRVSDEEREEYAGEFQAGIVEEWVKEGHLRAWGNLNDLDQGGYSFDIIGAHPGGFGPLPPKSDYWPLTFRYPPPNSYFQVGIDVETFGYFALFDSMDILRNQTLFSNVNPYIDADPAELRYHSQFHSKLPDSETSHPHSFIFHPVYEVPEDPTSRIVASTDLVFAWDAGLRNLLPDVLSGITVVTKNNCNQSFTYNIDGADAFYLGEGDRHGGEFDHLEVVVDLNHASHPQFFNTDGHCVYTLSIYPSSEFRDHYLSSSPLIFVIIVSMTFLIMVAVFYIYDWSVQRRNDKITQNAARSNEIVTSMFPSFLRDAMIDAKNSNKPSRYSRAEVAAMLEGDGPIAERVQFETAPLAEYYRDASVFFGDLVGFTSWSSMREPTDVFRLLETSYRSFDEIARQRQVFKVETVGDCYVAATGFPQAQSDHAIRMCRFAKDCQTVFQRLIRELETTLGPDTANLALRVGIHSGPVTGGVIRGDRARFQLFGDTMNTTARVETNGASGRIHISQDTADLLIKAGKQSWLEKRPDPITAKGKGLLQTYWCNPKSSALAAKMAKNMAPQEQSLDPSAEEGHSEIQRAENFIDWNVIALAGLLRRVVACREARQVVPEDVDEKGMVPAEETSDFLGQLKEIISFPIHDVKYDPDSVELSAEVMEQLRYFVGCLANMHRPNDFHNFERASYSVQNLLKMLEHIHPTAEKEGAPGGGAAWESTFGVTADPLTHFACAVATLIHFIEHPGVSDAQVAKEYPGMAQRYNFKFVTEQNALDIALKLFMDPVLSELRRTVYVTKKDMERFRQLLVLGTLGTDTLDKDILKEREHRWDRAFGSKASDLISEEFTGEEGIRNRKATAVLEHVMIMCYLAPSIYSWHIYTRWNKLFFTEAFKAWKQGRAEVNPALYWENGGLQFFDTNIMPSVSKLVSSGVFGLMGDSYMEAARKNRREWVDKGGLLVATYVEELNKDDNSSDGNGEDDDDDVFEQDGGREWLKQGEAVLASMVDRVYEQDT